MLEMLNSSSFVANNAVHNNPAHELSSTFDGAKWMNGLKLKGECVAMATCNQGDYDDRRAFSPIRTLYFFYLEEKGPNSFDLLICHFGMFCNFAILHNPIL